MNAPKKPLDPLDIPDFSRSPVAIPSEIYQDIKGQNDSVAANVDPRFVSLSLPSKFLFYPFKSLSVRPIGLNQQRKIANGLKKGKMRTLVEALRPCIDQDIFQLTIGDFWAVLFWLKANSFKKTGWNFTFTCRDAEHVEAVQSKQKPASSLSTPVQVTDTMIQHVELRMTAREMIEFVGSLTVSRRVSLHVATVADLLEGDELIEASQQMLAESDSDSGFEDAVAEEDAVTDEDDLFIQYASVLSREHGTTLAERIQWLEEADLTADETEELDSYIARIDHGVNESINVTCAECGTSRTVPLSLDVRTFLPSIQH